MIDLVVVVVVVERGEKGLRRKEYSSTLVYVGVRWHKLHSYVRWFVGRGLREVNVGRTARQDALSSRLVKLIKTNQASN